MSWKFNYAPPVSHDSFQYDGRTFCVKIDEHRHPRCDPGSLYRLLTYTEPEPLLTKAGKIAKRQPAPHKDSPGHFYQAQCVHYGLKAFTHKATAKKHLLAAFNAASETLLVPPYILALEQVLKEEYNAANEVAAKEAEEKRKEKERALLEEQKKRREGGEAMFKEFEAVGVVISRDATRETDSENEAPLSKSETKAIDAQLRRDIAALSDGEVRTMLGKLAFDRKTPKFKKAVLKEMDAIKKARAPKAPRTLAMLCDTLDDTGEYWVVAPYLQDTWAEFTKTTKLKMSPSPGRSHFWVWFHFGVVSGIMRSCSAPPVHVGDTTSVQWRGREEGEGEMTYDETNTASITFIGDGRIRGQMCWSGETFEFIGKKVPRENVVWSMSVREWKDEYKAINDRSYAYASRARWGGWHAMDEADPTSNSDTADDERNSEGDDGDESDAWPEGGF